MDLVDQQLRNSRTIAVVGLSPDSERPSHFVAKYLQENGYRIIPINPLIREVLGERCHADLRSAPGPIDLVDIFRRSEHTLPIVEQAIEVGARYIWMQDGIVNEEAAAMARAAGLSVVMDNCAMREHRRRYGGSKTGNARPADPGPNDRSGTELTR